MLKRLILSIWVLFNLTSEAITGTSYTTKQNLIDRQDNPRDPRVSVFSDFWVGQRYDLINVQFLYNIPTDLVTTTTVNTGTVTHDATTTAMALVQTGTNSAGASSVASIAPLRYTPGHEAYVYFTAAFTTGVTNSTQWVGLFDAYNGFAIGYNGTEFSTLYRQGVTGGSPTDTITPQSSFSIDLLDGTGPSGLQIDPTKFNLYRITFGWLGAAPITFEVCRRDGVWVPFHNIQRANTATTPSVYNPVLPITVAATNAGNTSNLVIKTASWSAGTVGQGVAYRQLQHSMASVSFGTSETFLTAIRNNSTNNGKTNRVTIDFVNLELAFRRGTGGTLARFRFYKNATLTGGSWTSIGSNSAAYYNDTATFSSAGTELLMLPFGDNAARSFPLLTNGVQVTLQPGDVLTVTGTGDVASCECDVSLLWRETIA